VYANAHLPDQASLAYAFGARGIGLCRTEHMFFGEGRIPIVQRMILAESEAERRKALSELLPLQREDFYGVFKAMRGCPVTIRTIDPPLHEFLPKREDLMVDVARLEAAGKTGRELEEKKRLLARVEQLHEFNPMLGHRGVRLGITYPEITEMQTRAIIEAACRLNKEGIKIAPEIMIPLVGLVKELSDQKAIVDRVAADVMKEQRITIKYLVGTMIEIPRGCIVADQIAREAQFFSFGTNDLTQLTFGFSRDDSGKFLKIYQEKKILEKDPFASIDTEGVGDLVRAGVERGRRARPSLKIGICGEHGGDPASVHFFHEAGLDYVSASPYRVPVARLAAAQAAILTLGFRGEALPSIASVSHFVLRTRAKGQQSGTEIRVNGGAIASIVEIGAAQGTVVEVNDVFYNLPARRKFLKSDAAESAQVSRIVTQLALAYPEVGFTLTSAGRKVLQCPPA